METLNKRQSINIAFEKNTLPIVFASNQNYLPYMCVAIKSLINSAKQKVKYNIYILHTNISEENQNKVVQMQTKNIKIQFVNVTDFITGEKLYAKDYFSTEMYYRLLIPTIFQDYEKVLYLDSDIIVTKDISDIFETNISNYLVAGVKNEISYDVMQDYVKNILKMDFEEYFNSGVLLFNTALFRRLKIKEQCFEFLKKYKHLVCPDQDLLNLFCYGKWLKLNDSINFQVGNELFTNEYKQSRKNDVKIIHFTSSIKPWNSPEITFADEFFEVAKTTPFANEIKNQKTENLPKNKKLKVSDDGTKIESEKHNVLLWPFRMIKEFFVRTKNFGIKKTFGFVKRKLTFLWNRITFKVDKHNHQKINENDLKNAKSQNYL